MLPCKSPDSYKRLEKCNIRFPTTKLVCQSTFSAFDAPYCAPRSSLTAIDSRSSSPAEYTEPVTSSIYIVTRPPLVEFGFDLLYTQHDQNLQLENRCDGATKNYGHQRRTVDTGHISGATCRPFSPATLKPWPWR